MCGYLWVLVEALVPDGPSLELLFVLPFVSVFSISSVLSLSGIHPALLAYLCQLKGGQISHDLNTIKAVYRV